MAAGEPRPCLHCGSYACGGCRFQFPALGWNTYQAPPKPREPTPEQLGWIPITEGLPVERRVVWLLRDCRYVTLGYGISPHPDVWEWKPYYDERPSPLEFVTHWQPLQRPNAPKG